MRINSKTKKLALCAVLTSLAIALSIFERLIPLNLFIPVPGVKLGLANVVTMFALIKLSKSHALLILFARTSMTALLVGTFTSYMMSLTGALFAFLILIALNPLYEKYVSIYGMSIAAAGFHNIGQVVIACFMLNSVNIITYLPFLLIISIISGLITGQITRLTLNSINLKI